MDRRNNDWQKICFLRKRWITSKQNYDGPTNQPTKDWYPDKTWEIKMHKTGNGHGISSTVTLLGRLWLYSRLWRHFVDCDVCFSLTVTLVRRMWRCYSRQWRHFVDCDIVLTNCDVCIRWLWRLFVLTVTPVCVDCDVCLCWLWHLFVLTVASFVDCET